MPTIAPPSDGTAIVLSRGLRPPGTYGSIVPTAAEGGGVVFTDDGVAPGVPAGVWLRPDGTTQLRLTWNGNSEGDLSHYEYRVGTANPPTDDPVEFQPTLLLPGTEAVTLTGKSDGTTYYAQVRAVDLAGNASDWSTAVSAVGSVLKIIQAAGNESGPTSATPTVTLPATPTDGNLLLAWVANSSDDGANIGIPTGFTAIGSVGTGNVQHRGFYKVASGDTAVISSSLSGATSWIMAAVEIAGQDATPVDVSTFEQEKALGPTGATAQADEIAVGFWGHFVTNEGAIVAPTGWGTLVNRWSSIVFAKQLTATGTVSGTITTRSGSVAGGGAIITVRS